MNKKRILIFSLSIILLFFIGFLSINQFTEFVNNHQVANPPQNTTNPARVFPSPTPIGSNNEKLIIQDFSGLRPSQEILQEVLGISEIELKNMSQKEIENLYIQNAEILGVQVWESNLDKNGNWTIELVAGSEIFDPRTK